MSILFITKELPYPPNSGCRNRTLNIIKALSKNNKILLLCHGEPEKDVERVNRMRSLCESVFLVNENKGSRKQRLYIDAFLSLFSLAPFGVNSRYSVSMKDKAREILSQWQIDLIICDSIYQVLNMPEKQCFKILSEHNVESVIIKRYAKVEKNIFRKAYALLEWLKMRHYEHKVWPSFDRCIVVSESDRAEMHSRIKNLDIEVVANGVDTEYFSPRNAKEKPLSLVYMGQMDWHPNVDAMIYFLTEIYPIVKKRLPDASLSIIGSNPPEKIKELAKSEPSVKLTGLVDDTRPHIAQGEIFIVPLRIGGGTRLKILEAMAMGRPIVSTAIGCEGLDAINRRHIMIADSPNDFAEKVTELANNPALRLELGKNGRKLVEDRYSWNKVVERLYRIGANGNS